MSSPVPLPLKACHVTGRLSLLDKPLLRVRRLAVVVENMSPLLSLIHSTQFWVVVVAVVAAAEVVAVVAVVAVVVAAAVEVVSRYVHGGYDQGALPKMPTCSLWLIKFPGSQTLIPDKYIAHVGYLKIVLRMSHLFHVYTNVNIYIYICAELSYITAVTIRRIQNVIRVDLWQNPRSFWEAGIPSLKSFSESFLLNPPS